MNINHAQKYLMVIVAGPLVPAEVTQVREFTATLVTLHTLEPKLTSVFSIAWNPLPVIVTTVPP